MALRADIGAESCGVQIIVMRHQVNDSDKLQVTAAHYLLILFSPTYANSYETDSFSFLVICKYDDVGC